MPGECCRAVWVAGQSHDGEVLEVHQVPTGIITADGYQHGVRREHVLAVGEGLVEAECPLAAGPGPGPRRR